MYFRPFTLNPRLLLIALVLMLGSVGAAELLKPSKHWSDAIGSPHYATLIPTQFGDWVELKNSGVSAVDPVQEDNLLRLYTETFARGYIHKPTGRLIMLSIAYGKDQSTDTQLHTPEQCYPSQGFRVDETKAYDLKTQFGVLPSTRMRTSMGNRRVEPLTYFVRVGDEVARGSKDRNLTRLSMALKGYLVDGMLFRVSEITKNEQPFELQDQFIVDLLSNLSPEARTRIIGGAHAGT